MNYRQIHLAGSAAFLTYVITNEGNFWSQFTSGHVHLSLHGCGDCPGRLAVNQALEK